MGIITTGRLLSVIIIEVNNAKKKVHTTCKESSVRDSHTYEQDVHVIVTFLKSLILCLSKTEKQ